MNASITHIRHQLPVIATMGKVISKSVFQRNAGHKLPELPSGDVKEEIAPRDPRLVADFIKHVGADPATYQGVVPFHMFPQWSFAIAARNTLKLPYEFSKIINAGCRVEINGPLRIEEPLQLTGRLESVDDNGERVIITNKLITETPSEPEALVAYQTAIIPLSTRGKKAKKKKQVQRVPVDAECLGKVKLSKSSGWEFAVLTGDFNPLHWIPAWARMMGHKTPILHGYSTMSRSVEKVIQHQFGGDIEKLKGLEVKFTNPLPIPGKGGVFVSKGGDFYMGSAAGGKAYLVGSYTSQQGKSAKSKIIN